PVRESLFDRDDCPVPARVGADGTMVRPGRVGTLLLRPTARGPGGQAGRPTTAETRFRLPDPAPAAGLTRPILPIQRTTLMALDLTPDQRELGKANFRDVSGELTRRGFMKSMVVAGASVAVAGPAAYYGYQSFEGKPVKAAIIGT